ncbi:MAG: hypothetical protein HYR84_05165 [Planctomycetes bacterium]|nr:hypothetical protein [Planctomycetota bacterium]
MAVRPQVSLFFPCANVETNETTNTIVITNPLSTLYLPPGAQFPCSSGILFLYVDMKGGVGKFHCRIRGRDEKRRIILETKPKPIVFTEENRFDGIQFAFRLPEFELAEPCVVEFELLANYAVEPIATAFARFRGV